MHLNESQGAGLTPAGAADASRLAWLSVQAVLRERSWRAGCAVAASGLAAQLGCKRVAMGWLNGKSLKLVALSHGAQVSEHAVLDGLAEAMHESLSQGLTLCLPRVDAGQARLTLAHRSLLKREGLAGVMTVPLADGGEIVAALTCEREGLPFAPHEILLVEQVAAALGPTLVLKRAAERGLRERLALHWQAWKRKFTDPSHLSWRIVAGSVAALAVAVLAVPLPHRVSATARVEGAVQRVMSAPQDGYLRQVHVRPGDAVRAGQLLAELSDEDLQWQLRSRQAELAQQENAFADAFARSDRTQAAIAQAKSAEARAQLALVQQQLGRTKVTAPFDGVVIAGDLTQKLGAPLKRSEALFTLSPLQDFRVVLEVDEREIAGVLEGQRARLLLSALPAAAHRAAAGAHHARGQDDRRPPALRGAGPAPGPARRPAPGFAGRGQDRAARRVAGPALAARRLARDPLRLVVLRLKHDA
jgi:biotin carboxyl carrier protein